ncbi:hypothetical protein [Paenibacillus alvei]|uniref:Uncharacterized protein n=1 Tax=Paenibacillus alvei TaxID=44250 RepID=A0AAP6ZVA2_PAEAL|nr:hypothetical protein [Paenibacillus alvei]MCY9579079.1 hypothetical protein [Paenibacillus alvei]NOJ70728.1 hypothetical protein [Paenibacillus alvei]
MSVRPLPFDSKPSRICTSERWWVYSFSMFNEHIVREQEQIVKEQME